MPTGPAGHRTARPGRLAPALAALGAALALVVAPLALAFELPPSQPGRSVYDFAGIWTAATVASAEQTAARLRSETGVEMAIVSLPTGDSSVSTGQAETDAKLIMDTWGVGKRGVNNGIVVLFDLDTSLAHGQIYVYGGSGILDRYISAAAAGHIASAMLDKAKQGDLDAALGVGMAQIADAVDHPGSRLESNPLLGWSTVGLVAVCALLLGYVARAWWRDGRDPPIPTIDDSVLLPAPPPGMTPSMAALLRDGNATSTAPSAALVDLASRNLLTMREGSRPLGLGHAPIEFLVTGPYDPGVADRERGVGAPELVILNEMRGIARDGLVQRKDFARAPRMQDRYAKALGAAAAATPWFRADPTASISRLSWVPFLSILALVANFYVANPEALEVLVSFVAVGVCILVGSQLVRSMAARTTDGSWALGMALAYRNTLRHEMGEAPGVVSAQQHAKLKLPWLETPDALIVWAVALGLAKEVGELLSRSAQDPASANWQPTWYAGSAASFASFGSSISTISTSAASSSGGGYGGGSSSGGGGGGGGF